MIKKEFFINQKSLVILLHVLFLFLIFILLKSSGLSKFNVDSSGLLNYDATWYNDLKENGYIFKTDGQSNSGFYPAFPYLWKISGLSTLGISILNGLIFIYSVILLAKHFNFSTKDILIFLSVPSLIFNYVPYTESMFFLSSTLLLIGLHKENGTMTLIGLFSCCFIRPVTVVFIPILIAYWIFSKFTDRKNIVSLFIKILFCLLPLLIVTLIQWSVTGVWFAHSKAQIAFWDHNFHIPHFPLTTWGGPRTIWIDGTAFWIGLLATGLLIYFFFSSERKTIANSSKAFLFSLLYLSAITLMVLFLNGYNENGNSSVLSLNRYFFATPFFFIAFHRFLNTPQLSNKNYIYLTLSLVFVWLLFGAYTEIDWLNHTKTIIYFSLLTASIMGCVLLLNHKWFLKNKLWMLLYVGNCLLQVYLFFRFLSGDWVG